VTGEEFTNDLVAAIRESMTGRFREKYRGVDLLLVDDFHFIGGKVATQEEFLHTLQALFRRNAQVVIAADCPPKRITDIDPAIMSRISGGLKIDIGVPKESDLAQVIREMLKSTGTVMAEETILLIAGAVLDIQGLIGAINQVTAMTNFIGKCPDQAYIFSMLNEVEGPREKTVEAESVISAVAKSFSVPVEVILGDERLRAYVTARHMAMFLVSELTHASLNHIAGIFRRDHTTVRYGIDSAKKSLAEDKTLAEQVELIREQLLSKENRSRSKKRPS
jgi:chromosomal replication initiator protein